MLRAIPVTPGVARRPRRIALRNVPYYFDSRVIFQTRSKFWAKDAMSPNMEINEHALQHVWSTCDEVARRRGACSSARPPGPVPRRRRWPRIASTTPVDPRTSRKPRCIVWIKNPWASACETTSYPVGQLAKFWPTLFEPVGRVHFVGAYADNLNWGMEAATRSANRVAEAIDG